METSIKITKQELLTYPAVKEIAQEYAKKNMFNGLLGNNNLSCWEDFVKSNEPVREWGILSIETDYHRMDVENGMVKVAQWASRPVEELLKNGYEIKKVRRLSDGEIFVVGDNTQVGIITSFEIQGQNMIAKGSDFEWHINQLQKAKREHIFITDDNVKIYEGDEYFFCGEPLIVYSSKAVWYDIDGALQNTGNKHFSTREKAEEYCLMNRPCLSVSDVLSFTFSESVHVKRLQEQLLELAKSKQNNS